MFKKVFGFVLILFLFEAGFCQIAQSKRVELEIKHYEDFFNVISGEQHGIMILKESSKRVENGYNWEFIHIDTSLNITWRKEIAIDFDLSLIGFVHHNSYAYLLFDKNEKEMELIKVGFEQGDTSNYKIQKTIPVEFTHFDIVGQSAILAGAFNARPVVFIYDFINQKIKTLPGFFNNNSEITQISVDNENNNFSVISIEKGLHKKYYVGVRIFDQFGSLIHTQQVEPEDGKNFVFGIVSKLQDQYLLVGTYAKRKSKESKGIFFTRLDSASNVNYYAYTDFENFFNYMKAKRKKRVKDRIERKKIKGQKLKFNYRLLVHDIMENNNQYIMLGEAYFPKYQNNSASFQNLKYNLPTYHYTHAVVFGFDKKGQLLWDNSFEINDVKTFYLKKYVHADVRDDKIVLLYMFENVIRSKFIKESEVLEGKTLNEIKLLFEDDVAKNNEYITNDLNHWYGHFFYAYGIQRIKNLKESGVKLNRKIFYINKLSYE